MASECKSLLEISKARRALAVASSFSDVMDIRDKAVAAHAYAKAANLSLDVLNEAASVRLLAERKAGEMLAEAGLSAGRPKNGTSVGPFSLDAIGVTKNQSSRWQRIAAIPEDEFEQFLADSREKRRAPTSSAALRLFQPPEPRTHKDAPLHVCIAKLRRVIQEVAREWPDEPATFATVLRQEADALEALIEEDVA